MNTDRRVLRRLAAALLAGSVAAAGLLSSSSPAQAAGCAESRTTARDLAAAGDFTETTAPMELLALSLRTSASAGCAWGVVAGVLPGAMWADVWIDRSADDGASWVKSDVRRTRGFNTSTYTTAYSTEGYNAVRACGDYTRQNISAGGTWWNPQGISRPPTVSDIYCTGWVTP
ncbi:hypothetical protein ACWKSP_23355 [Micromonosporaceae bacterium Da 78-11]